MKKETLRAVVVAAVIFVIYHLIAFVVPFAHTAAFWVSYGFTLVAFVLVCASLYIALVRQPDAKSRFYGFPIARVGVVYGIVQLIASLVAMALALWLPWWIPMLVYALMLGAAVIGLVGAETVIDEIKAQDATLKTNVARMHGLRSKVAQLAAQAEDIGIQKLAEELRYSDPVSSEAIASIEADLEALVDQLQDAQIDGDAEAVSQLCRKAMAVLAERNRLCKLNKN